MKTNPTDQPARGLSRSTWVLIGFLAVAAYFLFTEHRAHLIEYLPFLLVLACPLMHLFHGHGGHGAHGVHGAPGRATPDSRRPEDRHTDAPPQPQGGDVGRVPNRR